MRAQRWSSIPIRSMRCKGGARRSTGSSSIPRPSSPIWGWRLSRVTVKGRPRRAPRRGRLSGRAAAGPARGATPHAAPRRAPSACTCATRAQFNVVPETEAGGVTLKGWRGHQRVAAAPSGRCNGQYVPLIVTYCYRPPSTTFAECARCLRVCRLAHLSDAPNVPACLTRPQALDVSTSGRFQHMRWMCWMC